MILRGLSLVAALAIASLQKSATAQEECTSSCSDSSCCGSYSSGCCGGCRYPDNWISTQDFINGNANGEFAAIFDMRQFSEWDSGHLPNATKVGPPPGWSGHDSSIWNPVPEEMDACASNLFNTIVVYCSHGCRAQDAVELLKVNNYPATVKWTYTTETGFNGYLDNSASVEPECGFVSVAPTTAQPTNAPTTAQPTGQPTPPPTPAPTIEVRISLL